ncbi:MAG: ATP-binding protein [Sphingomonadaceae bacterium]
MSGSAAGGAWVSLSFGAALGTGAWFVATEAGLGTVPSSFLLLIVTWLGYRLASFLLRGGVHQVPLKFRPPASPTVDAGDRIGIASLADPALIVSPQWRVLAANEGALGLFGQRITGADLRQTVRHPVIMDAVRLGMQGNTPVLREVTTLGAQDGAFRVRVVALGDGRQLLTFTDITQARLTERMRADFVANASHELRTPLANISGFIETLLGPAFDDEPARRRFLEIMSREAGRMSRLIDDLLSLSRIELDKYVRPQTVIDLPPLLSDVGKTLAMRLEGDGRKLVIELEAELPQVVADRDQMLQVLHNLISNALKYGRSGTPIVVSAARDTGTARGGEEMVRVSVTDEGEGIAPEHLPRLTERFYRVDTGRSRSMGGTGLGLAIVKHIVERHRGRLDISSRQGEGTTVSFLVPAVSPAPRPEAGPDPAGAPEAASQIRNEIVT